MANQPLLRNWLRIRRK